MKTLLRRSFVMLLCALALLAAGDAATYDADAWIADLDRVEADMAQGYANLDWIAAHRGLDLAGLDRSTRARLHSAHSRVRAFLALRSFVRAFRDPHLALHWGERTEDSAPAQGAVGRLAEADGAAPDPVVASCEAAGYEEGDHAFRFPVERLQGWHALAGGDFPFGRFGDVGVLRIAALGENKYLAACQAVLRPGIGQRGLQLAVRARQQAALRTAIAALRQAGARRLLVDVSGNGGGSEWVSEVIALMTPRRMSRAEARVVAPACDRRGVWTGKPACSVFAPASERATLEGTGEWNGPVFVLADRKTASAAEDLVAWLQQNRVARVIGERTMGAGCGYVDGGTRTQLRASHFDVLMPNCARFLDDGRNEIEGIAPDIAIDMHADDAGARARSLDAALARG